MQVDDVATPATSVDAIYETLDVASSVGVVAAVPRRRRAQTHTRCHEVFPIGKHGIHVFCLTFWIVGSIHRFVVCLHVRRGRAGPKF